MIDIKSIIKKNILLKMTSLNALVIVVRLVISVFVQRFLAISLGESGIAKIGQLRNLMQILTSTASLGVFNGVVKYVSENSKDRNQMSKLFSSSFFLVFIGSLVSSIILFLYAEDLSVKLFGSQDYIDLLKCLSLLTPVIGLNRIIYGLINGLSDYKRHAKIELGAYILSVILLLVFLYNYNLKGVLFSIVLTPFISFAVIFVILFGRFRKYIKLIKLNLDITYIKPLLAFAIMSFVSTFLINYIELDVRTTITNKININEAGYWTAINFISKNYMVFSASLFTLYVIPKFATIDSGNAFVSEVIHIYKTLLPLFAIGMLIVFFARELIIELVYPNFEGMEPLFKWQLLGDFVRIATLVISHQFLAKKMVWSFVITELISLGLFYFLSKHYVEIYGAEGVVMAHFYRYIIYFIVVIFTVWLYFKKNGKTISNE